MNEKYSKKKFEKFVIISCFKKDEHSAVYLANHIYLDKKVILKVLNVKTLSDKTRIDRFKREAKILAKLEHPNIIKVFDFGIYEDYFYISFEYFNSKHLREVININELTDEQKKSLLVQMLKGLSYAHQKKIIHRDIKPENILVNDNLELKITDFGLALPEYDNFLTKQYSVLGTPAYMSPEQIKGEKVTHRSDLFSLGIVTYELYKNINPFMGKDVNESVNNILSFNETKLSEKLSDVPKEVKEVLLKLLTKNTEKRFQSAAEVLTKLNIILEKSLINEGQNTKQKYSKMFIPIILLLSFGIIYVFYSLTRNENNNNNRLQINETKVLNERITNKEKLKEEVVENILVNENQESKPEKKNYHISNKVMLENAKRKNEIIEVQNDKEVLAVNEYGKLFVECYPWADIYIDNKKIETTPIKENLNLLIGKHTLKLKHPGFPDYKKKVIIEQNKVVNIKISLDTVFAYLDCKVFPWGEIYLDNKKVGDSPLETPLILSPGKYNLTLKNPDYKIYNKRINLKMNDTLTIKYNFNMQYEK